MISVEVNVARMNQNVTRSNATHVIPPPVKSKITVIAVPLIFPEVFQLKMLLNS